MEDLVQITIGLILAPIYLLGVVFVIAGLAAITILPVGVILWVIGALI